MKYFSCAKALQAHVEAVHLQKRYFKCKICSKNYQTKYALNRHMNTVHANPRDHVCDVDECGKVYQKLESLLEHQARDHGVKNLFECEVEGCSKRFNCKAHMLRYILLYSFSR